MTNIATIALRWTPDGRRKYERPNASWRRTAERDLKEQGMTWSYLEGHAQDRPQWFFLVSKTQLA